LVPGAQLGLGEVDGLGDGLVEGVAGGADDGGTDGGGMDRGPPPDDASAPDMSADGARSSW
jgi:hypothetical protein